MIALASTLGFDPGPSLTIVNLRARFLAEERNRSVLSLRELVRRSRGLADLAALAAMEGVVQSVRVRPAGPPSPENITERVQALADEISDRSTIRQLNYNSPLEIAVQLMSDNSAVLLGVSGLLSLPHLVKQWAEARQQMARSSVDVARSRLEREAINALRRQLHQRVQSRQADEALEYDLYPTIASAAAALARLEKLEATQTDAGDLLR